MKIFRCLSGTVRDASGAVLPDVEITATHTGSGLIRTPVSNEAEITSCQPCDRSVPARGLEVGQATESVEFTANASMVETRSSYVQSGPSTITRFDGVVIRYGRGVLVTRNTGLDTERLPAEE